MGDKHYISVDPRVMSGTPCLRGTRIPVGMILGDFLDGLALHEVAENRDLDPHDIEGLLAEVINRIG
jgi:uncharacterized protein (DUF433 family)